MRAACVAAGEADPVDEATELLLKHHGLAEGTSLWLADGAGFALVHDGALTLAVAPPARGAGLGTALVEASRAADPTTAWSHGDHPAAARLARRHGFARARELWVLRRPTALPLPETAPAPGVSVRGFEPADRAGLLAVNAAAFATHPEQGAMDEADLAARMAEPWFDPAGLLVAVDAAGELLGFHWTKRHSPGLGEVYVVGIAPPAQGRGLGRQLTVAGLHHLAGLGVTEVLLHVEADNAPALAVYTRLGFTHAPGDTHVRYARGYAVQTGLSVSQP